MTPSEAIKQESQRADADAVTAQGGVGGGHKATRYDGPEFAQTALDTVIATSPRKAFELIFRNSEFLSTFLTENQGLKGAPDFTLCISELATEWRLT